ncbi:hypothetical protein [Gorillibacterium sp. CAU 1737]|uniref:hypothetical protein n=1 Tax=Gorillibacterium sp. CAU 1737 TaxID=3140362 RepID=UPI003261965C
MTSKSMSTLLKMHWINMRLSVYIYWAIMLVISVISFTLMLTVGNGDTQINMGAITSVSIYMLVLNLVSVNETFRYALGMNFRRKDFYGSTVIIILLLVFGFGTLSTLLSMIEKPLAEALKVNVSLFGIMGDAELSSLDVFLLYIGCGLFLSVVGLFTSVISYRFGKKGVLLMGAVALLLFIGVSVMSMEPIARFFASIGSVAEAMAWLMLPTVLLLAGAYPLMMSMTTKE